ncbi:MAG: hypothetical protein AAB851_00970 [Patescibacteria group bacterium]
MAEIAVKYFSAFQEKKKELAENMDFVKKILKDGEERARSIAEQTMKEVKEKIGLI